jgi:lantibiotic biosynthesis protein
LIIETQEKLESISSALTKTIKEGTHPAGLYGGHAGMALFYSYYGLVSENKSHIVKANEILYQVFEQMASQDAGFSFGDGLSGIGWLLAHLHELGLADFDADYMLSDLDEQIFDTLLQLAYIQNYDFIYGGMGCLKYLQKRNFFAANKPALDKFLQLLRQNAICKGDALGWFFFNVVTGQVEKKINLGLSHGMPSIPLLLSKINVHYSEPGSQLIFGAMRLLEKSHGSYIDSIASYPYEYPPGKNRSRMAWCYGDLGIAATYLQVGKNSGADQYIHTAENIMQKCVERVKHEDTEIIDASLCHGSAGAAQIFTRFYWDTRNPLFAQAANYWHRQTLSLASFSDGLAGYKSWQHEQGWQNNAGLLEGVTGTGLALLSSISKEPLSWDECLLLS